MVIIIYNLKFAVIECRNLSDKTRCMTIFRLKNCQTITVGVVSSLGGNISLFCQRDFVLKFSWVKASYLSS